jgi:hypothetical protein
VGRISNDKNIHFELSGVVVNSRSVKVCAEFDDAGVDGFYRKGKGESAGLVQEKNDAIEGTFAGASGKGETQWMKKIAAAKFDGVFEAGHYFFKFFGSEGLRVKKQERQMAKDFTGGVAGENGVGFGPLKNFAGGIFKD